MSEPRQTGLIFRSISWTAIGALLAWILGATWWVANMNARVDDNEHAISETNADVAAIIREKPFERITRVETRVDDIVRWFQPAAEKAK